MKATWIHKRFSEVCTLKKGKKPKLHAEFQQGFAPYLIARYLRGAATSEFVDIRDKNAVLIKKDQIFVICDGSNSGEIFTGFEGVLSSTMALIEHTEAIDSRFLRFFLDSLFEQFNEGKTGSAIPHLDLAALRVESLPLPPLSEQHRIVAILDTAFDQISTARANCEANLLNARAIFESHLQAVFTQRGDGWVVKSFDEVLVIKNGKDQKPVEKKGGKYPIYGSAGNVMGWTDAFICDEQTTIIGRKGTINKPLFIETKFWNVDTAFGLAAKPNLNAKFLYFFCLSYDFSAHNRGTTIPSLVKTDLLNIKISIPSINAQEALLVKFSALHKETQRLESLYQRKLQALDDLKKSLLHQAFSGLL